MDVQGFKKDNDGYGFLLTVIDVLSKYAWVVPLKEKTGKSLVDAFDTIFKKEGRVPERLQTDAGKTISKQRVSAVFGIEGRAPFFTYNETKVQIVKKGNI